MLDYLIGTLATAYKGLVSSLIAKDFSIADEGGVEVLRLDIMEFEAIAEEYMKKGGVPGREALWSQI